MKRPLILDTEIGIVTECPFGIFFVPETPTVRYVAVSGGDDGAASVGDLSRPYATVAAALAAAAAGDTVLCLPGTHIIGKGPLTVPVGVTLAGCGWATVLSFDGSLKLGSPDYGCCIQPATGSRTEIVVVRDLAISVALSGTTLCGPIGVSPQSVADYPDLFIDRVRIDAVTDGLYANVGRIRVFARSCLLISNWDLFYCSSSGQMEISDCVMYWRPKKDVTGLNNFTMGQITGVTRINDSVIYMDGGSANTTISESQWQGIYAPGKAVFSGLRLVDLGGFSTPVPKLCTNVGLGSQGSGTLVLEGSGDFNPCDYSGKQPALNAPPRIFSPGGTWLTVNIFAAASDSASKNNYFRLSTAATSQNFDLFTLPAGHVVEKIAIERRAAAGTVTTATIELGIASNTTKYLSATDIKTTGMIGPTAINAVESTGDPVSAAGTIVRATVRTTGGNVSAITSADLYVRVKISGPYPIGLT